MNRRIFLQATGTAGLGLWPSQTVDSRTTIENQSKGKQKHWVWIPTDLKTSEEQWKQKLAVMRQAGISAIIPEIYNGRHADYASRHMPSRGDWLGRLIPLAKAEGLEVHAWMWCMPCNREEIYKKHPEWFCVNGRGESAADKPAYVNYYRFLCPSHPEVRELVASTARELCQYGPLDGIHLDYIRFPDVILAEALQPKYKIAQDREYPQYDYCYCELCRRNFRKKTGIDPLKLPDPSTNLEWRQFRQDLITALVNKKLVPIARKSKKQITAAVFPNWEHVRQQWSLWQVDALLPMLYHSFYRKDIPWIQEQTAKGVQSLKRKIPLYSGLFVSQLNPDDLVRAMEASLRGGAGGVALFSAGAMSEPHWKAFRRGNP